MKTFNKQGLKLVEEIKTNPEYSFIKKEVLIQFGFDLIILRDLVEWIAYSFMDDFEEITGDDVQNERRYNPEMIGLLSKSEREEIWGISEVEDNLNPIEPYKTADGKGALANDDSENRKRKERYVIVNKKEWLEIGQSLKEQRLGIGISLTKIGRILKTSTTRISNMENGKGVMMADHLIASYKLVLELERIKLKEGGDEDDYKNTQVNYVTFRN